MIGEEAMTRFKVGDIVVCKDNRYAKEYLIVNQIYRVIDVKKAWSYLNRNWCDVISIVIGSKGKRVVSYNGNSLLFNSNKFDLVRRPLTFKDLKVGQVFKISEDEPEYEEFIWAEGMKVQPYPGIGIYKTYTQEKEEPTYHSNILTNNIAVTNEGKLVWCKDELMVELFEDD